MASRKKPRRSATSGKDFEQLLARVEAAFADSDVAVRWNDKIRDVDDDSLRQIDVSLRARVGSATVLVIVECRDRGRMQTVEWVEQLASKARSVRAHKAICVSRNGFTETAMKKARALNIELRTLQQLTDEKIRAFLPFRSLALAQRHIVTKVWRITYRPSPSSAEARVLEDASAAPNTTPTTPPEPTEDSQVLRIGNDGELFSADALKRALAPKIHAEVERVRSTPKLLESVGLSKSAPTQGRTAPELFSISIGIPELQILAGGNYHRVTALSLIGESTLDYSSVAIGKGRSYAQVDGNETPLAATYELSHVSGLLPPKIELVVIPGEERFAIMGAGDDGKHIELCRGTTRLDTPPTDSADGDGT